MIHSALSIFGIFKQKFVLLMGEEGVVLVLVNGKEVEARVFAASPSAADRKEAESLLRKHPSVPIYVLLNTVDQTYTKQSLPAVSSLSVGKLIKRRMDRDYPAKDIKGAIQVGKQSTGRKDWIYLFATCSVNPLIEEWMNYFLALSNPFAGIYFFPLESQNILSSLYQKTIKQPQKKYLGWQLWMSQHKTGGFRQVVTHEGKVVFTRLINIDKDNMPDVVAGHVEQEIANTVEYLHRLGFENDSELHTYIVVAREIRDLLDRNRISGKEIFLLTPHELAVELKLSHATRAEDHFVDVLCAVFFATHPHVLKLSTPASNLVEMMQMGDRALLGLGIVLVPMFLVMGGLSFLEMMRVQGEIATKENDKARIEQEWKTAESSGNYNLDDANRIFDIVDMHRVLTSLSLTPQSAVQLLVPALNNEAFVKSFNWTLDAKAPSGGEEKKETGSLTMVFNVDFYNTGDNIEDLFRNFDAFTGRVKEAFKDYDVEHSKLPEKIAFGSTENVVQIQITIKGPKAGAAAPPK